MKPTKTARKPPVKVTINSKVRWNGVWLADRREMAFSELVEALLVEELRANGVDPWSEKPGGKLPAKNKSGEKPE